jgi:ankyrin repeat protein
MRTNKKPTGDNLLLKAVEKGDLKTVRECIAAGADINAAAKGEAPPLFVAVSRGHLKVVEELISAGAEVNRIAYPRGASVKASPLSLAIDGGHWKIMQTLLKAGAQIGLEHYPGENAAGEATDKAINAWYRANGSEEDSLGKARTKREKEKFDAECKRWMQFVRDAIADGVKVRDYWLWSAARHGFAELAAVLIASGTNVNAAPHGSSALESAIEGGHLEIVTALAKAGADLKPAGEFASPALLVAAAKDRNDIVSVLFDAGAEINAVGDATLGEFSLEDPEVEESKDAKGNVTSLTSRFVMPPVAEASSAVVVAVRRGNAGLVRLLAERGVDLSLGDKHGVTALTWGTKTNLGSCLRRNGPT